MHGDGFTFETEVMYGTYLRRGKRKRKKHFRENAKAGSKNGRIKERPDQRTAGSKNGRIKERPDQRKAESVTLSLSSKTLLSELSAHCEGRSTKANQREFGTEAGFACYCIHLHGSLTPKDDGSLALHNAKQPSSLLHVTLGYRSRPGTGVAGWSRGGD
jgi:hypothetical protein